MTQDDMIQRIVIVGGGTAGWMAAAAFSRVLGAMPGLLITLIESDAIGTVGVGEATIPDICLFNNLLGINENLFMRETGATYKLGIEFVDWYKKGHSYVHPFGNYGIDMLGIEFHHMWLRGLSIGDNSNIDEYSIATMAGKMERFMRPDVNQPNSPLSKFSYAFQFDAGRYAQFLRRRSQAQGVERIEGKIVDTLLDSQNGHVRHVQLEDGSKIEGDLFIDCSGFRALLIGGAMGVGFEDWTKWLPCDRAVAMPCAYPNGQSGADSEPLTRSIAQPAGWQWRIPLQHRIGNGHVYSSAHMNAQEAEKILRDNLDGEVLGEANHIRFTAGHRKKAWVKNVISLGLSGGFLEPLESTAIHLVQTGISRILTLFPTRKCNVKEIERFNQQSIEDYVTIRDFLILHYKATSRDDSEFWDYCRNLEPPSGLADKLAMFESSGRVFRENNELFTETSWLSVMVGQGVKAGGYHPAAHLISEVETKERLRHIRGVIKQTANAMPAQADFLRQQGAIMPQEEMK
ncbi:tryptophan halogenase [Sphingorhabdus lutea]|uniref:Tryptophan halogenase n=1 Tax=Sphingorhabdus lutea TaxID=1913578 RepID=A0A1L3JB11_9SPHN|nr:tryptophan halogenase family protein [Sphingorhabdus lutea]APG62320.1 tryptophan halogenase [Sphingorhabdus lutea]